LDNVSVNFGLDVCCHFSHFREFFCYVFLNVNNMEMFFLFLLSALYKGSVQLHPKYLLPQYTIISCNPVPTFLFILRQVLTIHIIKHFMLAAGYDGGHSHCGSVQVLCKAICLVTNISSRNLSLHMIYCCSMKFLLSSISRP
jgi:hypothetical protein